MGGAKKASPAPVADAEAEAKKAETEERKKTIERQRRGIEGTINTSHSGILKEKERNSGGIKRKNLLGE